MGGRVVGGWGGGGGEREIEIEGREAMDGDRGGSM
jgi:hypothetical protein